MLFLMKFAYSFILPMGSFSSKLSKLSSFSLFFIEYKLNQLNPFFDDASFEIYIDVIPINFMYFELLLLFSLIFIDTNYSLFLFLSCLYRLLFTFIVCLTLNSNSGLFLKVGYTLFS